MFGYDQQIQFATTMAKSFTDATNTAMQSSTAFWSGPKAPEPGRSWYRPPAAPNPFDWRTWAAPANSVGMPWNAWGATFNPMMMTANSSTPWSAIAAFASAMAAMQPAQTYWASFMPTAQPASMQPFPWQSMMWPMAQFGALASAMTAPAEFASYRSTGGHATAQITFANAPTSFWPTSRLH